MHTPRSAIRFASPALRRLALAAFLAACPILASAKTVMVIAPHPDDETLIAAGRVRAAVNAGDKVVVVVVTNGDANGGTEEGLTREDESVTAAGILGVPEASVVFLGYGDGLLRTLYDSASGTQVYTSPAGRTATYGARGLGGADYHTYVTGQAGQYTRNTLAADLKYLLIVYKPDELYTVAPIDGHPDHSATADFVTEALVAIQRQGGALQTRLFQTIVWAPETGGYRWPQVDDSGFVTNLPFFEPSRMDETPFAWERVLRFTLTEADANRKLEAIEAYVSQGPVPWLSSFARSDEFYWATEIGSNRAFTATVTTSSGDGARAIDGRLDDLHSWSAGAQTGWIQLSWTKNVKLSQVVLSDLPISWNNVLGGTLTFSDGSAVAVPALPVLGQPLPVVFAPRSVRWVRFTITSAEGTAGLAEFQALGPSPYRNTPPIILAGPLADLDPIYPWETATFTVDAADLDGEATSITWTASGGTIQGSGSTVVFQPPTVSVETTFTVTARVADPRGGVATSSGIVTVHPAFNGIGLSPSAVLGGQSAQGILTSATRAPAGGLVVGLESNNAAVTVPATVTIPEGALNATFTVTTAPVAGTVNATITTSGAQTATLTVYPPLGDRNLAEDVSAVRVSSAAEGQGGMNAVDGVVDGFPHDSSREWAAESRVGEWIELEWPSPVLVGGVTLHDRVNLTDRILSGTISFSDGTSVSVGELPNDGTGLLVRFPERVVTTMRFSITSAVGDFTGLAELEVFSPNVDAVTVSPARVIGGGSIQGTVVLAVPASVAGELVAVSSGDPQVSVPASVLVPAGASTASFTVGTPPVSSQRDVTITATSSRGPVSTTLTLVPLAVTSFGVTPSTFPGGQGAVGTIGLSAPTSAPLEVALSTTDPQVTVPATITIAAGTSSATFAVTSTASSTARQVTVIASIDGSEVASTDLDVLATNLARIAGVTVTVSSENTGDGQLGTKAIDGVVQGYSHGDYGREWATVGGGAGSWIRLTWSSPVTVQLARIFDRPNADDQVMSGRLVFSDGGSDVAVGTLPNEAASPSLDDLLPPLEVSFAARTVTWVEFRIDSVSDNTRNIGLSELELYGQ